MTTTSRLINFTTDPLNISTTELLTVMFTMKRISWLKGILDSETLYLSFHLILCIWSESSDNRGPQPIDKNERRVTLHFFRTLTPCSTTSNDSCSHSLGCVLGLKRIVLQWTHTPTLWRDCVHVQEDTSHRCSSLTFSCTRLSPSWLWPARCTEPWVLGWWCLSGPRLRPGASTSPRARARSRRAPLASGRGCSSRWFPAASTRGRPSAPRPPGCRGAGTSPSAGLAGAGPPAACSSAPARGLWRGSIGTAGWGFWAHGCWSPGRYAGRWSPRPTRLRGRCTRDRAGSRSNTASSCWQTTTTTTTTTKPCNPKWGLCLV